MNPHERKRAQEDFRTAKQVCVATEVAGEGINLQFLPINDELRPSLESNSVGTTAWPHSVGAQLPAVAIGRSGQTVEWIAARRMADIVPLWRKAADGATFKPYGYAAWFDLAEDPDARSSPTASCGRDAMRSSNFGASKK
jgi:hypothetical protein